MQRDLERLCVFAGTSGGRGRNYKAAARRVGRDLAKEEIEILYGGFKGGMGGSLADAALAEGGRVIGIVPQEAAEAELVHDGLSEVQMVRSMRERNQRLADLADAILVLPGGLGTFADLFELAIQPGKELKPCGLLNVCKFFDHQLAQLDVAVAEEFIDPEFRRIVLSHRNLEPLLDQLSSWQGPDPERDPDVGVKHVVPHKRFQDEKYYWFYEHELDELDERRRLVLELRVGLADGRSHSLEEVAKQLGLTTIERVRQIQTDALRRCRLQREPDQTKARSFERAPAVDPETWRHHIRPRGPEPSEG